MISPESRAEFEYLQVIEVRKKVDGVSYGEKKHREAIKWLDEQDPARASLSLARTAGTRANIAIVVSIIAVVVAAVLGILPYIIAKPHG